MKHDDCDFVPLGYSKPTIEELEESSSRFYSAINSRRSVRTFSDEPVPRAVIENIIRAAGTAPSGAHKQPWTFCTISNKNLKSRIREAAEKEEFENYHGRMSEEWLKDLEKFGTDHIKPFLEIAPWIIVVCKQAYGLEEGDKSRNYYVNESVGIATGMLITAIHQAGLTCLTHTPSPMNFLTELLERPSNERAYLLIPVGFPAEQTTVPNIERKPLDEIAVFYE